MFNMIKLDWLAMKYYQARIIILPILLIFIALMNEAFIIPVISYAMLSYSVNPFAMEEKGKLDNLYLTLPVTRHTIVNARFGLSFFMQLVGIALGTVITVTVSALLHGKVFHGTAHNFEASFQNILLLICASLLFYAVMNLSMFPILFKIGYIKGKMLGFIIPIIAALVIFYAIFILIQYNNAVRDKLYAAVAWVFANPYGVSAVLAAATVLVLTLSVRLSYRTYVKRVF